MDPLFKVHMVNSAGKEKAQRIAQTFENCLSNLRMICPENTREFAIVKTKLEEACFFAKKSMANVPENQQEEA